MHEPLLACMKGQKMGRENSMKYFTVHQQTSLKPPFRLLSQNHPTWLRELLFTHNYIKEKPKQCLWFLPFFFPPLGIYTATDLHHNAVKHIKTKMKEERRGEKKCVVTCVTYKAAMNFCTNLWCDPKSQAGWLLAHCFCSTKSSSSLFQPFMVFL